MRPDAASGGRLEVSLSRAQARSEKEALAVQAGVNAARHADDKAASAAEAAWAAADGPFLEQCLVVGQAAARVGDVFEAAKAAAAVAAAAVGAAARPRAAALAARAATQAEPALRQACEPWSRGSDLEEALIFAKAVHQGLESCKDLRPNSGQGTAAGSAAAFGVLQGGGGKRLAVAAAVLAAAQAARAAGWSEAAQHEAAAFAGRQAGASPAQLERIAAEESPNYGKGFLTLDQASGAQSPEVTDSWTLYEQIDSSPQSGVDSFGQTGKLSLDSFGQTGKLSIGSQRFSALCSIDEVQSALSEAEKCLSLFEEERKLQMQSLQRQRSRKQLPKMPKDVQMAMTDAQRILSAFDEERRQQLSQLRRSRSNRLAMQDSLSQVSSF